MKLTTRYGVVEGTPEEIAALLKKLIADETPWQTRPVPRAPRPSMPEGVYVYAAPFPKVDEP